MASQNPADTITTGPITAKIETIDTREVGLASVEFVILWINFILFLLYRSSMKYWKVFN